MLCFHEIIDSRKSCSSDEVALFSFEIGVLVFVALKSMQSYWLNVCLSIGLILPFGNFIRFQFLGGIVGLSKMGGNMRKETTILRS